jgi:hypothetical protein
LAVVFHDKFYEGRKDVAPDEPVVGPPKQFGLRFEIRVRHSEISPLRQANTLRLEPHQRSSGAATVHLDHPPIRPAHLDEVTTMTDFRTAKILSHQRNIKRYARLLATALTELERQYLHKRIAEEQAELELSLSAYQRARPNYVEHRIM